MKTKLLFYVFFFSFYDFSFVIDHGIQASLAYLSLCTMQGLSSRKVGATTINSKSSRSHIVFTFIIESWCKVP